MEKNVIFFVFQISLTSRLVVCKTRFYLFPHSVTISLHIWCLFLKKTFTLHYWINYTAFISLRVGIFPTSHQLLSRKWGIPIFFHTQELYVLSSICELQGGLLTGTSYFGKQSLLTKIWSSCTFKQWCQI